MLPRFLFALIGLRLRIAGATHCDISSYAGTGADAAAALQACIDNAASGGIIELPVGLYSMDSGISINKPLTLTSEASGACQLTDSNSCSTLQASPSFYSSTGILHIASGVSDVWLDHLIIDGNRHARLDSQAALEVSFYFFNSCFYNVLCVHSVHRISITEMLAGTQ